MRQTIIGAVAVTLLLYVAGVVYCVQTIPDIGLHCSFRPVINRVDRSFVDAAESAVTELEGAQIKRVADRAVTTWPQMLRTLRELDAEPFDAWDDTRNPRPTSYRDDAGDWVRVDVVTAAGRDLSVWCVLGRAPPVTVVPSLIWFALELCVFSLGAAVVWQRPHDRPAALFFALTSVAIVAFMGGYHWSRIVLQPLLLLPYMIAAVMLPAVSLHFYHEFPRAKPWYQRRPRLTLAAIYGVPAAFLVFMAGSYLLLRWLGQSDANPALIESVLTTLRRVIFVYFAVAASWYLAGVVCLAHGLRVAQHGVERNQVRWLLLGALLAIVPMGYTLYLATWYPRAFGGGAAMWPMFGASLCFIVAYAVSAARYRFLQLDQLLSSGLAYFLVSCLAGGVYYVLVFVGTLVIDSRGLAGPSLEQAFWVSGSALVLTIGLDIARGRLRNALDRRLHRDKAQLDRTLHELGAAIDQLVDPHTLARRFLHAVGELFGVEQGAVYLREGEAFRLVGSRGRAPETAEVSQSHLLVTYLEQHAACLLETPLRVPVEVYVELRKLGAGVAVGLGHEGQLRGFLALGPRTNGYSPDDLRLLTAFTPMTALALGSAEGHRTIEALNRELQAKVEKISEQQRRILTLQQQLVRQSRRPDPTEPPVPSESTDAPLAASPMVGGSPALREVLATAAKAAASGAAVLVRGESGTGKELLAQAIHDNSPRAGKPFVKVHCAALAPGLLESELFGHVKGAFTGAIRDKVGRFEQANCGTLFLDEIGDIDLAIQTKLLRVLQEKVIERVGSGEPVAVDVRLVAATHQPLEKLIKQGRFREDLYYRLNVISLRLPSLRERAEDVPELAAHFARRLGERAGKPGLTFDDDALLALRAHRWPGNIRELENAVERAVVVAAGPVVGVADLPPDLLADWPTDLAPRPASFDFAGDRGRRDREEREQVLAALAACGDNKAEAARLLGVARSTLVSKLKKWGALDRTSGRV